jgi:hypothetical protein
LKPERWGSLLVQEKYQEEKACDKRHPYCIIIIITIITIVPTCLWWVHKQEVYKLHPRTGHEGPEREQMYSPTLPLTLPPDAGGWSTPRPGRFNPGKKAVPIV